MPCRERFKWLEVATDIDDDQVGHFLDLSPLSPTLSESHGMLCGFICGGAEDPETRWLEQLLPGAAGADPQLDAARDGLRPLAEQVLERLGAPDLGIELLLPDDTHPLEERAIALYDWVRGLLFALGVLGISEQTLSEQTREVLRDLTELTRLDLDDLDETEENEVALNELIEFVRVAALLIDAERGHPRREIAES